MTRNSQVHDIFRGLVNSFSFPVEGTKLKNCTEVEIERQIEAESDAWAGIDPVCLNHSAEIKGKCRAHGSWAEICEKCQLCSDCANYNLREYKQAEYEREEYGLPVSKRFKVIE